MNRKLHLLLFCLLPAFTLFAQEPVHDCAAHRILHHSKAKALENTPKTYVGMDYDLAWHRCYWNINPAVRHISGSATTLLKSTVASLSTIEFELHTSLTVDSVVHHNTPLTFTHSNNVISISLPTPLLLNQFDSLTVYYGGTPASSGGFGAFEQNVQGGKPVIWTLSEPYGAKFWWPCKNDLSDKPDSVDIIIRTPNGNLAASNGVLLSQTQDATHTLFHWKHRYPIATYLIAIAVTEYAFYTQNVNLPSGSFPVWNYIYPADTAAALVSLDNLLPVYAYFDSLFMPYPFKNEKYGHAQFSWGGGMEHQTMTFMGNWNWDILVHELAHQWFGNYITCGSWHDIWLNEGFATYLTGIAFERLAPQYWKPWLSMSVNYVTGQPGGSVYVDDTTSVNRVFSSRLSYYKGAMVLHMLRHVMGNQAFYQGIGNYLADPALAYGYATTSDLKAHLEAACTCNLTHFFDAWVYGQGYPTYTFHLEKHNGSLYKVYVNQTQSDSSVSYFQMPLPLRFYGNGTDTTFILNNTQNGQEFWVDAGFIPDSVHFDPDLWMLSRNNQITIGIDEKETGTFSMYPNPTADRLNVVMPETGSLEWRIFTPGGALVRGGKEGSCMQFSIDISSLPKGFYLLEISNNHGKAVKKLIKQ